MDNFELTLPRDVTYTDRSYETASWYDTYVLKAGTYPVTFVERFSNRYANVTVDAVLAETYKVNRVFTASSVDQATPNTETTYKLQFDSYMIQDAVEVRVGNGFGRIAYASTDSRTVAA